MNGNQAIFLTPSGASAIAVIRLIGPGIRIFLESHFSAAVKPGRCVHGELRSADCLIDDPVIALAPDGAHADINLHGGLWVAHECVELIRRAGFEVIETLIPPLPSAALDAESEIEREILQYLPLARTELAVRVLLAQRDAWLVLNDRHLPTSPVSILQDRALHWLLHLPRVAIIGAANVGKSTLANQLFGQERSITADFPGTTRDWVGEIANIDGLAVMLVDTPGIRATDDAIERLAIERARSEVQSADAVLLILDQARPLEGEQAALLAAHPDALVVINKSDHPAAFAPRAGAVATVATTGDGIPELRRQILALFQCAQIDPRRLRFWTVRQRRILEHLVASDCS